MDYLTGKRGPSGFGSSSTAEDVVQGLSLSTRVAIVTGASSGIGFETARVLAEHGVHVVVPARKIKDAEGVKSKIVHEFPDALVTPLELDLSELASVRKFAAEFKALNLPLNIIINNAGVGSRTFKLSRDGLELDFATNHMGHFLLVELLLDDLIRTATDTGIEGRVVVVASEAHQFPMKGGIDFENINDEKSFRKWRSYGQSKLANILYAKELARRLELRKVNVTVNSLHPGVINTRLARDYSKFLINAFFIVSKPFTKNIPQGAATTVYVAVHPKMNGITGKYLSDCNEAACTDYAKDMNLAGKLWEYSENFVKTH